MSVRCSVRKRDSQAKAGGERGWYPRLSSFSLFNEFHFGVGLLRSSILISAHERYHYYCVCGNTLRMIEFQSYY